MPPPTGKWPGLGPFRRERFKGPTQATTVSLYVPTGPWNVPVWLRTAEQWFIADIPQLTPPDGSTVSRSRPQTFRWDEKIPDWQRDAQWTAQAHREVTPPPDASTVPLSVPPAFRWDQKTPDWRLDPQWTAQVISKLVPASPFLPYVPTTFRRELFAEDWTLSRPWRARDALTIDSSSVPLVTPPAFRWDQKIADWTPIPPWTQRTIQFATPDASLLPLVTPLSFRWDQKILDWQLISPWRNVPLLTPPDGSILPLIDAARFRWDQKIPDWQLGAQWAAQVYPEVIPQTYIAPSPFLPYVLMTFRRELFTEEWTLSSPWRSRERLTVRDASTVPSRQPDQFPPWLRQPETWFIGDIPLQTPDTRLPPVVPPLSQPLAYLWFEAFGLKEEYALSEEGLLTPEDFSGALLANPPRFTTYQFVPEWWLQSQWVPPVYAIPQSYQTYPAPLLYGQLPQVFRIDQFPPDWRLVVPWTPRALQTPQQAYTVPFSNPGVFRIDQFPPDWRLVLPWGPKDRMLPMSVNAVLVPSAIFRRELWAPEWVNQTPWGQPVQGLAVFVLPTTPGTYLQDGLMLGPRLSF